MSVPDNPKFVSNWRQYSTFLRKQDAFLVDVFKHDKRKRMQYQYERVLAGLIHRHMVNFRAIYRSWQDFGTNHTVKFSIYSLLRPLIADYLLMLYLLDHFKWLVPTDAKDNRAEWKVNEDDFVCRYENISTSYFQRLNS
jgi:hypothetical protein